jgi:predicted Zn-dependent protease
MRTEVGYQILVDSYKRANRFADAKRVIAESQAQGKDAPELHQALYRIAMIERDPETLRREAAWAKNQPELYTLLEAQAVLAADGGKYSEAEELFKSAILSAGREVDADRADNMLMDEVSVELQLGRTAKAVELIKNIQHRDTANFAILQSLAGDVAAGEAYLRKPETYPQDTIEHDLRIPELKGLIALRHGDPSGAIAALEPARPFELGRVEVTEVRAEAYLAAGQGDKAAAEFQKIIANPGVEDIVQPRTVLAHLGLARAYALQKKIAESRSEYAKFLALFQEAAPDLAILDQAQRENLRLPPSS